MSFRQLVSSLRKGQALDNSITVRAVAALLRKEGLVVKVVPPDKCDPLPVCKAPVHRIYCKHGRCHFEISVHDQIVVKRLRRCHSFDAGGNPDSFFDYNLRFSVFMVPLADPTGIEKVAKVIKGEPDADE